MSHNIKYHTYPENVDKKKVQRDWDNYVRQEDWQEGCSGLGQDIRWLPDICETQEAAELFIHQHDRKCYDQLAVRFRCHASPSATTKALQERFLAAQKKYEEMSGKRHFADVKEKYIGCKSCGSRISSKYLKANFCPVCLADMRPETVLKRIRSSAERVKKLKAELEASVRKDAANTNQLRWLVKIEYHT